VSLGERTSLVIRENGGTRKLDGYKKLCSKEVLGAYPAVCETLRGTRISRSWGGRGWWPKITSESLAASPPPQISGLGAEPSAATVQGDGGGEAGLQQGSPPAHQQATVSLLREGGCKRGCGLACAWVGVGWYRVWGLQGP
jgi:hypothetical protein